MHTEKLNAFAEALRRLEALHSLHLQLDDMEESHCGGRFCVDELASPLLALPLRALDLSISGRVDGGAALSAAVRRGGWLSRQRKMLGMR